MKLLCDEDVGTGVPTALSAVGLFARPLVSLGLGGHPDIEWLAFAGANDWLVFSYDKKMMSVPEERATIVRENVGVIFLTSQTIPANSLYLLLRKWTDLELLDGSEPRPFVRFLNLRGQLTRQYRQFPIVG